MTTPDIGSDIADAINLHLRALRYLKKTETTVENVSRALGIPEPIVVRAFAEFKMVRAKINARRSTSVIKSHTEFTPVIELKQ